MERGGERVEVLDRIVRGERRPHRRLVTEASKDRLGAVVTGADGDAFPVEHSTDLFRLLAVEDEGDHAGLLARRADELQAWNRSWTLEPIGQKIVLVPLHAFDADTREPV